MHCFRIDLMIVSIVAFALVTGVTSAGAQNEPGRGWGEGVVVTDRGELATRTIYGNTAFITVRLKDAYEKKTENDPDKGGFYAFRNLRPGIYEVFVDACVSEVRGEVIHYRPQHIFGLVVEADKRTVLNITMHEGKALEEVGKPNVASENALILANELARMRKEFEDIKRQVNEIKE